MVWYWEWSEELSPSEQALSRFFKKRSKFYFFLRSVAAELFDKPFQDLLSAMYDPRGEPPVPPALWSMLLLLQAYTRASDAETIELARFDQRWRFVLGVLDVDLDAFRPEQSGLSRFRARLIEHDMQRALIERTLEMASNSGLFSRKRLHAQLDSAPLAGAGRVDDTFNLIGRAMEVLVRLVASSLQRDVDEVLELAGLSVLGHSSLKAGLDIAWDDPQERHDALQTLLEEAQRLSQWVHEVAAEQAQEPPLRAALETLSRVTTQDTEPDPDRGGQRIKRGTARQRQVSVSDPEMRHGRKSKSRKFNGYKRFLVCLAGSSLIVDAHVQPANMAEHYSLRPMVEETQTLGTLVRLDLDRGFLGSEMLDELEEQGVEIVCKPWPLRNAGRFTKADFELDLVAGSATCPAGEVVQLRGRTRRRACFGSVCASCQVRERCTTSVRGRTLSIHPNEERHQRLREAQATPEGRRALRARTEVEHRLADTAGRQGIKARYRGTQKNSLHSRIHGALANLLVISRSREAAAKC